MRTLPARLPQRGAGPPARVRAARPLLMGFLVDRQRPAACVRPAPAACRPGLPVARESAALRAPPAAMGSGVLEAAGSQPLPVSAQPAPAPAPATTLTSAEPAQPAAHAAERQPWDPIPQKEGALPAPLPPAAHDADMRAGSPGACTEALAHPAAAARHAFDRQRVREACSSDSAAQPPGPAARPVGTGMPSTAASQGMLCASVDAQPAALAAREATGMPGGAAAAGASGRACPSAEQPGRPPAAGLRVSTALPGSGSSAAAHVSAVAGMPARPGDSAARSSVCAPAVGGLAEVAAAAGRSPAAALAAAAAVRAGAEGLRAAAGPFPWPTYFIGTRDSFTHRLVPLRSQVGVRPGRT
jgi:hypothetical protein